MHAALLLLLLLFMLLLLLQLALLLPLRKSVCIARNHSGAARPVTLRSVSLCSALLCAQAYSVAAGIFNSSATHTYTNTHTHTEERKMLCQQLAAIFALFDSISITTNDISEHMCVCIHIYLCVCVCALCVCSVSVSLCVCVQCTLRSAVTRVTATEVCSGTAALSPEHLIFIVSCTF